MFLNLKKQHGSISVQLTQLPLLYHLRLIDVDILLCVRFYADEISEFVLRRPFIYFSFW